MMNENCFFLLLFQAIQILFKRHTYRLLLRPSTLANRDVLHSYSTARSCILFRASHWRIEFRLQCRVMKLLCWALGGHMAGNSRVDNMNHLDHYYLEFLSQDRHFERSIGRKIKVGLVTCGEKITSIRSHCALQIIIIIV